MDSRKRRDGVWHHRVPDFKLVYCGYDKNLSEEASKRESAKMYLSKKKRR